VDSGWDTPVSIASEIRRFIRSDLLEGPPEDGDPLEKGLLDSLAIETLVAFLEDRYGIRFRDEDVVAERFVSVDAVARLVQGKLSGAAP
jgi:acyl carrier protein